MQSHENYRLLNKNLKGYVRLSWSDLSPKNKQSATKTDIPCKIYFSIEGEITTLHDKEHFKKWHQTSTKSISWISQKEMLKPIFTKSLIGWVYQNRLSS